MFQQSAFFQSSALRLRRITRSSVKLVVSTLLKGFLNVRHFFPATALSLALLTGCATTQHTVGSSADANNLITPEIAIMQAANAAPDGVPGTFFMLVQGTGSGEDRYFLNSQPDYRNQRNLTIVLSPQAHRQLVERFGGDPLVALTGKEVVVRGTAIRTRIDFFANGRPTNKYYYQTRVQVTDAEQISVR